MNNKDFNKAIEQLAQHNNISVIAIQNGLAFIYFHILEEAAYEMCFDTSVADFYMEAVLSILSDNKSSDKEDTLNFTNVVESTKLLSYTAVVKNKIERVLHEQNNNDTSIAMALKLIKLGINLSQIADEIGLLMYNQTYPIKEPSFKLNED